MLYSPIPKYEIYEICEIYEVCEIYEICDEALPKASYQNPDPSGDRNTIRLNDPNQYETKT